MQRMKRCLSLLLVFTLVLSPLAGSIRAYAEGEEIGEPETQVVEPQVEETDPVSETQAEKPEKEPEEAPEAESTTPLGEEEQEQPEVPELSEEKVGAPVRRGTSFETLKQQVEEAADGAVIQVAPEKYLFTEKLMIQGKNIEFKVESGTATFCRDQNYSSTMIEIAEGAGLTLNNGIVMDGEMRACERFGWGGLINNLGKLVINGGVYQNDKIDKQRGSDHAAPIYVQGENAILELHGGTIRHNDYSGQAAAYAAGAVMLRFGATMIMEGGTITENEASIYDPWGTGQYIWSDSPGAGGILVEQGCTLTMKGGEITKNVGYGGGVLVGAPWTLPYTESRRTKDENKFQEFKLACATFEGGTIKENEGIGGGGISGHGNVEITIPKESTLEISENKAWDGGGIAVMDWAVATFEGRKDLPQVPIETWSKHYAGKLTMAGGTVKNNEARRTGGGIYIATNEATITGGLIDGNRAGDQGGGFYLATIPYTLHMENAYVASNHATNDWGVFDSDGVTLHPKTGGGVWFCPTGTAVFNAEHGALIMTDNEAGREAAGFFSAQKAKGENYSVTLAERALSGGKIEYYTDGTEVRNGTKPSERIAVKDYTDNLAVKTVLSDGFDEAMVKKLSSLVITNNTASKGGGIGSNGNIIFGTENTISLTVKKIWADGTTPKPVEVEIRGKLGTDDWLIEKIQLNEKNRFTYTLNDLPATVAEKPLQDLLYVKELNADDYKVEISPIAAAEGGKTFAITVKNKKKPTTPTHAQTEVPVTKVWEDEDNREMKRPASITVRLYANGKATDKTLVLSAENGWHGSFVGLDKYDVGEEIRYTVEEETILPDYESVVSGTMEGGFTITNSRKPEKPPVPEKPPIPEKPRIPAIPVYPRVPIIPKAGIGA